MKPKGRWLEVESDGELFVSWLLGELFDRRTNSTGFQVTQLLRPAVTLKPIDRLQAASGTSTIAGPELGAFAAQLAAALPAAAERWFWFENGDPPLAGAAVTRVEVVDAPGYFLVAGFDTCRGAEEGDLRAHQSVVTPEGSVRIRSESAAERFGAELARLERWCSGVADSSSLRLVERPPPAAVAGAWRSFDRARCPGKALPVPRAVQAVLGPLLRHAGYAERSAIGLRLWVRDTGTQLDIVHIDHWGQEARLRPFLGVNLIPSVYPPQHLAPERPSGRACELTGGEELDFASQAQLEAALLAVWTRLSTDGEEWLRDPSHRTDAEWLARGFTSAS